MLTGTIFKPIALVLATSFSLPTRAYTWPDYQIDYLEQVLYETSGPFAQSLGQDVFPCSTVPADEEGPLTGRTTSAEWLRTAYHDVATANVTAGTGGVDASIGFETDRPENVGSFINTTLLDFSNTQSPTASMADVIALGAVLAVASCSNGSVIVPLSAGRIDATEAGPFGVPQPQDPLDAHIADFARQGFNADEMIALVACGHTLGGVHGVDFPTIVPVLDDPNNADSRVNFDETVAVFDNSVAVQFVNNVTQNPLAFGPNVTTRSDQRIFTSDGGKIIHEMAQSLGYYLDTCTPLLERMLNTVPRTVTLTEPITFIPVKPQNISLSVSEDGSLVFGGSVRLLEGEIASQSEPPIVNILYVPRNGSQCADCILATTTNQFMVGGSNPPHTPTFRYYSWYTTIPISTGISGFRAEVVHGNSSKVYGNDNDPFPMPDSLIVELGRSLITETFVESDNVFTWNYSVTASARDSVGVTNITFTGRRAFRRPSTLAFSWAEETIAMVAGSAIGDTGYTTYTLSENFVYSVTPLAIGGSLAGTAMFGVTGRVGEEEIGYPYIFDELLPLTFLES